MGNKEDYTYNPRVKLQTMINNLQLPAGSDPKFSSLENIRENRDEFIEQVHLTWKRIHTETIREIITIESLLVKSDVSKLPKDFLRWLRYVRRLFRRVNDMIVWIMIPQPHLIRRLSAGRPRPNLIESNPQSVATVLNDLNRNPKTISLWNDATTCIDVGDITCLDQETGTIRFIEVKEGKVNDAIFDLKETSIKSLKAGDTTTAENAFKRFGDIYGERGLKQAERVAKQEMRDMQILKLIQDDEGTIPELDVTLKIINSSVPEESYDLELTECLRRAEREGTAATQVDECLWIYVSHDMVPKEAVIDFSSHVFEASPETRTWLLKQTKKELVNPIERLHRWAFHPTTMPIALRNLDQNDVLDILYGKLLGRILLFFDWLHFEAIVRNTGCDLTWVRPQQVSGQYIDQVVGKRTPRIGRSDGRGIRIGSLIKLQMFGNGIKPSTVAAQYAELLEHDNLFN